MSVFGSDTGAPAVVKTGRAILKVDKAQLLALDVTIQFQRQVENVPVLGPKRVLSIGEPQGTFQANSVMAKSFNDLAGLHLNGENDCEPFTCTVSLSDGNVCGVEAKDITLYGCVASAVSVNMQGGRGYIVQGFQITFTGMDM